MNTCKASTSNQVWCSLPSGIEKYCPQHLTQYRESYATYKSLSNNVSSYTIMKLDSKLDFKVIDTLEYYTTQLKMLIPKLEEVITRRKTHHDKWFNDDDAGHAAIIKRYQVIYKLLLPIYNKYRNQEVKVVKQPLVIQPQPEFPYYIPTIDEAKILREQPNRQNEIQLEETAMPIMPLLKQIVPTEKQHVPAEYKGKIYNLPNGVSIKLPDNFGTHFNVIYHRVTDGKMSGEIHLPLNYEMRIAAMTVVMIFFKIKVDSFILRKEKNLLAGTFDNSYHDSFALLAINQIYDKYLHIPNIIKGKVASSHMKYQNKINSMIKILLPYILRVIKLTVGNVEDIHVVANFMYRFLLNGPYSINESNITDPGVLQKKMKYVDIIDSYSCSVSRNESKHIAHFIRGNTREEYILPEAFNQWINGKYLPRILLIKALYKLTAEKWSKFMDDALEYLSIIGLSQNGVVQLIRHNKLDKIYHLHECYFNYCLLKDVLQYDHGLPCFKFELITKSVVYIAKEMIQRSENDK